MSDEDESQGSEVMYVSLPPEVAAAVKRIAAATFSKRTNVIRQAVGEWLRERGELDQPAEAVS